MRGGWGSMFDEGAWHLVGRDMTTCQWCGRSVDAVVSDAASRGFVVDEVVLELFNLAFREAEVRGAADVGVMHLLLVLAMSDAGFAALSAQAIDPDSALAFARQAVDQLPAYGDGRGPRTSEALKGLLVGAEAIAAREGLTVVGVSEIAAALSESGDVPPFVFATEIVEQEAGFGEGWLTTSPGFSTGFSDNDQPPWMARSTLLEADAVPGFLAPSFGGALIEAQAFDAGGLEASGADDDGWLTTRAPQEAPFAAASFDDERPPWERASPQRELAPRVPFERELRAPGRQPFERARSPFDTAGFERSGDPRQMMERGRPPRMVSPGARPIPTRTRSLQDGRGDDPRLAAMRAAVARDRARSQSGGGAGSRDGRGGQGWPQRRDARQPDAPSDRVLTDVERTLSVLVERLGRQEGLVAAIDRRLEGMAHPAARERAPRGEPKPRAPKRERKARDREREDRAAEDVAPPQERGAPLRWLRVRAPRLPLTSRQGRRGTSERGPRGARGPREQEARFSAGPAALKDDRGGLDDAEDFDLKIEIDDGQDAEAQAAGGQVRFYLTPGDEIVQAPSIGPRTAARLGPEGIKTVRDLLKCDPVKLAARIGYRHITPQKILSWQQQARLVCMVPWLRGTHAQMLVGAGFTSVEAIVAADRDDLCAAVMRFLITREGQSILRSGPPPRPERIWRWIENAKLAEPQRVR